METKSTENLTCCAVFLTFYPTQKQKNSSKLSILLCKIESERKWEEKGKRMKRWKRREIYKRNELKRKKGMWI